MSHSPEQNLIPPEAKETREPKVDFDWDKHVKAEYEKVAFLDRKLKNLIIEGPKGSVDILQLVDATKVYLRDKEEADGGISPSGDVWINKFNNLFDLACLMHEFGHADQIMHKNFNQEICKLSLDINDMENDDESLVDADAISKRSLQIKTMAKRVVEMFPELSDVVDLEKMSGWFDKIQLTRIIEIPVKIVERDATARALKWLREISNQTGIDFFKKFKIEKPAELNNCQSSIQEGMIESEKFEETDIVKELNKFLKTYQADNLTKTYDPTGIGKRIKIVNSKQ